MRGKRAAAKAMLEEVLRGSGSGGAIVTSVAKNNLVALRGGIQNLMESIS